MRACVFCLAAVAALLPMSATADGYIDQDSSGIGLEVSAIDRSVEVFGAEATTSGTFVGVHAHVQRGAWLRLEGRALAGALEHESGSASYSDDGELFEARATVGTALNGRTRLYTGLGLEHLGADLPWGGSSDSRSVYLPLGLQRAGSVAPEWNAVVSAELRVHLSGTEELEDTPAVGDVEIDRNGGWGAAFSVAFEPLDRSLSIEPFVTHDQPADSETEVIQGIPVRLEEAENTTAGLRVNWRF